MINMKGFKDFIKEDPSLGKKYTYEEFNKNKLNAPNNTDVAVAEAYDVYRKKYTELEAMQN